MFSLLVLMPLANLHSETPHKGWINYRIVCELYDKPSFDAQVLAWPIPGGEVDILEKVTGQDGQIFYLIEYTVPVNQVMKGYVSEEFVATRKPHNTSNLGKECLRGFCLGFPW